MPDPVRVGVVGTGVFGSHHARHYAGNAVARLVAVVDADASRAEAVASRHGAIALTDHRELIGKVDAASVTAPAIFHHAIAGDLIDAGIHVFVEKPLAANSASARDLLRRAERAGVVLQVGHIERFSPAFRLLCERARAPKQIEFVRHTPWNGRSTDVDVVLDLMVHDIDLAATLAGSSVTGVSATGSSVKSDYNDRVDAELTFANGVRASLSASRVEATPRRTVTLIEADGSRLIADLGGPSLRVIASGHEDNIPVPAVDNLGAEVSGFLASVSGGPPPEVDGKAGVAAVEIAEMILEAVNDGRGSERKAS